MRYYIETERLILRDMQMEDIEGMFEMDSNPEVQKYLGGVTIRTKEKEAEVIQYVIKQYEERGIGRWSMLLKSTGEFIGWTGLKLNNFEEGNDFEYYDVGYRMIPRYWGKGYATESAIASLDYGFSTMNLALIYGIADTDNKASINVLKKSNLIFSHSADFGGKLHFWFKSTREEWIKKAE